MNNEINDLQASGTSPTQETYKQGVSQFTKQAQKLAERSRFVSNLRGVCFAALCIGSGVGVFGHAAWGKWLALLAGTIFAALIAWHNRVTRAEDAALRWRQVNRDALLRTGPDFKQLPDGAEFRNPIHPYADDLDLFGRSSLFQVVSTARTQTGKQRVAAYLMNRANPEQVKQRQEAVQELAPMLSFRQELEVLALPEAEPLEAPRKASKRQSADLEPLLGWAESKPLLTGAPALRLVSFVVPPLLWVWLFWCFTHEFHPIYWIAPLIAQSLLVLTAKRQVDAIFAVVSAHQGAFLRFGPMLGLLEQMQSKADLLRELKQQINSAEGEAPSQVMRRFEGILSWFEFRYNGMLHPVVNLLTLWDIHCVFLLEHWQAQHGKRLRTWFQALAEMEALASLAAFAYDHPEYSWPEFTSQRQFTAQGLGHPLILSGRVVNDVTMGGQESALLVTGSNMSGKSTLLRAIGLNAVLAQCGAPVCATRLQLCSLAVRTSLRISDSLDQGVSHFYAELRKLKVVLDATRGETPVLFLLDEILHGTNSAERQIGARWALGKLLEAGAIGAVSTHDAGLCELPPPLMGKVRQVHLRETAVGEELQFDYRLRSGPVQAGNALRLMRSLGLEVPLVGDSVP